MQRNGMNGCLIGCLVALGVTALLAVVVTFFFAPRVVRGVKGVVANEQKWTALTESWRPPLGSAAEVVFPERVGSARRVAMDSKAEIPELGLSQKGRHAVYESGAHRFDVYAYQGSPLEGEALLARVRTAVQSGERRGTQTFSNGQNRFTYSRKPPADYGVIWTNQGWTFFARSRTTTPAEFLRTLLEVNNGAAASRSVRRLEIPSHLPIS